MAAIYLAKSNKKSCNTSYSQVVSHLSTRLANTRLTSEIERDPVELVCMVATEKGDCGLIYSTDNITSALSALFAICPRNIDEYVKENETPGRVHVMTNVFIRNPYQTVIYMLEVYLRILYGAALNFLWDSVGGPLAV
jgi:hypothetical protein